ncbi:peptidyl-tRNA hydrolase Pth2 [[Eubacterium] cellulosolvens]
MEYKLVIVVRDDLTLSTGKLAVQVAHAAVNCALITKKDNNKWFSAWHREGQKKVVVRGFDLEQLHELKYRAKELNLAASLIVDAGLTEVPPETVTCLGIGPGPNEIVDKITGELKLL